MLHLKVIFKSITDPDDDFQEELQEHDWFKFNLYTSLNLERCLNGQLLFVSGYVGT